MITRVFLVASSLRSSLTIESYGSQEISRSLFNTILLSTCYFQREAFVAYSWGWLHVLCPSFTCILDGILHVTTGDQILWKIFGVSLPSRIRNSCTFVMTLPDLLNSHFDNWVSLPIVLILRICSDYQKSWVCCNIMTRSRKFELCLVEMKWVVVFIFD